MMAVVGSDGAELGQAAAVVVEGPDQTATHLLLCRLTPEPEYRLAPITLVDQVDEGTIRLRLPSSAVTTLPRREARRPDPISTHPGADPMTPSVSINTSAPAQRRLGFTGWLQFGLAAAGLSIPAVLASQALAVALWPDIALFRPLDSYVRSAVFVLVPALGVAAVFAELAARNSRPVPAFLRLAAVVLLVSFIPDYLLPDAHKTLLASSVAAFLHVIAATVTAGTLVIGYQWKTGRK